MECLKVIKIGGNVIDKPETLEKFLDNFCCIAGPKILVHGGGAVATELAKKLNIEVKIVEGRRITDGSMLKLVTMVYAGLINKQLVASLQKRGCDAIGLSGADGNTVPACKRKDEKIDWGFVGDVKSPDINTRLIDDFIRGNMIPVFCAITHDCNGSLLNTNADTMAREIAAAMSSMYNIELIYCFEKQGVLLNPDDDNSVIPLITKDSFSKMKESGQVSGGMIPKLDNAFKALENGVKKVVIKHADNLLEGKETDIILKDFDE